MNFHDSRKQPTLYIDHTHLGRHVTGLERITQELFSPQSLSPLQCAPLTSRGTADLIYQQNIALPMKLLKERDAHILCPGFPPSLALSRFGERVIPYIHDLFLMTRGADLNVRAKLYMAKPFKTAVRKLPFFLVNSQYTSDELRKYCREDAQIALYRPQVGNVFGLKNDERKAPLDQQKPLRLLALGTIEPRKNLIAAAHILQVLQANGHAGATLDIVGRFGWGEDVELLRNTNGVTLHGYQPIDKIRALMTSADLFINTSYDEGLGLPLLEAQYGGLQVIAPDAPVFREVLGESGVLIETDQPLQAAQRISALVSTPGWKSRSRMLAAANLQRWNRNAETDKIALIENLRSRLVLQGLKGGAR